jgi:hypothetical protein
MGPLSVPYSSAREGAAATFFLPSVISRVWYSGFVLCGREYEGGGSRCILPKQAKSGRLLLCAADTSSRIRRVPAPVRVHVRGWWQPVHIAQAGQERPPPFMRRGHLVSNTPCTFSGSRTYPAPSLSVSLWMVHPRPDAGFLLPVGPLHFTTTVPCAPHLISQRPSHLSRPVAARTAATPACMCHPCLY